MRVVWCVEVLVVGVEEGVGVGAAVGVLRVGGVVGRWVARVCEAVELGNLLQMQRQQA